MPALPPLCRLGIGLSAIFGASCAPSTGPADIQAPNPTARPVNQLVIAGNACGPAALLASLRTGNSNWTVLADQLPGKSDRATLNYLIRAHGLKPSHHLKNRRRWTREGINAPDLTDLAGEVAALAGLTPPSYALVDSRDSEEKSARRFHQRITTSLSRGFPPIVKIQRYVERDSQWLPLQSHFVTIVRVIRDDTRPQPAWTFDYFDPWGGKKSTGTWQLASASHDTSAASLPTPLTAIAPDAHIGRRQVPKSSRSTLAPTVVIGIW